jgi:hypothetical protein
LLFMGREVQVGASVADTDRFTLNGPDALEQPAHAAGRDRDRP